MIESSSSDIERASWISLPNAGFLQSLRRKDEEVGLLDGAYFGLNGDAIIDINEQVYFGPRGSILLHNPGLRKISQIATDVFAGKILVLLDAEGVPDRNLTFPEAENDGYIELKSYIAAWRYLGKESATMSTRILTAQEKVPPAVYQVTKKGVGNIAITERDAQKQNILYFFGLRPRI